jgi:hypothetical protein
MNVPPIPLTSAQEQAIREWAADDRLWTTQETVEFNLRIFARLMLSLDAERLALLAAVKAYRQDHRISLGCDLFERESISDNTEVDEVDSRCEECRLADEAVQKAESPPV